MSKYKGGEYVCNAEKIAEVAGNTLFFSVPKWILLFFSVFLAYEHDFISVLARVLGVLALVALIIDIITLTTLYKVIDIMFIGICYMILRRVHKYIE